jgi:NAD(P)-dependent dehydrogenase (short-subunit alcohol dehydrogenase family)
MSGPAAVLITGCSSGVGAATARRFLRAGHPVYATARRPAALTDLVQAGAVALPLDLTDEASMRSAVKTVEADHGSVGILVNNAAYGQHGAVETVPLEQVRRQFETNVFGPIRLTQLALPAMRARRSGRVINVSAMGSHFSLPGTGTLHASKHALDAVSDSLRLELRPFGVAVILIEPGPIRTAFKDTANATFPAATGPGEYGELHRQVAARLDRAYRGGVGSFALSADTVARTILRAARATRPSARYPVGVMSRTLVMLTRLLPDVALDGITRAQFRHNDRH